MRGHFLNFIYLAFSLLQRQSHSLITRHRQQSCCYVTSPPPATEGYLSLNVSLPLRAVFVHPIPLARDGASGGTWQAALLCEDLQPPAAPSSNRTAAMNRQFCSASPLGTGLLKSQHIKWHHWKQTS